MRAPSVWHNSINDDAAYSYLSVLSGAPDLKFVSFAIRMKKGTHADCVLNKTQLQDLIAHLQTLEAEL